MNPIIREKHESVVQLCRRFGVKELYVFGSLLGPRFSERSDIDFLVEFDWSDETNLSGRFFGLKQELEALFDRPVDLVCYGAIRNPYFKRAVEEQKEIIYAA